MSLRQRIQGVGFGGRLVALVLGRQRLVGEIEVIENLLAAARGTAPKTVDWVMTNLENGFAAVASPSKLSADRNF